MARPSRHRPTGAVLVALLTGLAVIGCGRERPLAAQVHHLDDAPWALVDVGGVVRAAALSWQHGQASRTSWRAERLGLMLLMPAGERTLFFLRAQYLRLDTADRPALSRWPQIRLDSLESPDEGEPDWPHEAIINGFGRPELGVLTPLRLPLAGPGQLSLFAGFPFGADRLYPLTAACLPLVVDWRRSVDVNGQWRLAARAGWERTFTFLADEIDAVAFPSGWRYGLELRPAADGARGVWLGFGARELADGRNVRDATLGGWLPLGDGHRALITITRSFGSLDDRHVDWNVGVTWHLAGLPQDESAGSGRRGQNATATEWPDTP